MAADSPQEQPDVKAETFVDDKSIYYANVVFCKSSTKVFVFEKDNKELRNCEIVLLPHGQEYLLPSSNEPLTIDKNINVESINLTIKE